MNKYETPEFSYILLENDIITASGCENDVGFGCFVDEENPCPNDVGLGGF